MLSLLGHCSLASVVSAFCSVHVYHIMISRSALCLPASVYLLTAALVFAPTREVTVSF